MKPESRQQVFAFGLLALLVLACLWVLRPFLEAAAWAAILGWATWPLYRRIRPAFGGREGLAAVTMTVLLVVVAAGPAVLLLLALSDEVKRVVPEFVALVSQAPPVLPEGLKAIPVAGEMLQRAIDSLWAILRDLQGGLGPVTSRVGDWILKAAGNVGRVLATVGTTLLIAYFVFRHGERTIGDVRAVVRRIAGLEPVRFLEPVGRTVRAVVYGILLTAMIQGTLAGIAFGAAGIRAPVLLGALTAFLALFPFGTPLVWAPCALWLWSDGRIVAASGVALWGLLVVGTVDNVIRPWVISGATQVPFLFVFFGVIGGVMAFGLLGLFLGPVLLSVLLTLWRESAAAREGDEGPA